MGSWDVSSLKQRREVPRAVQDADYPSCRRLFLFTLRPASSRLPDILGQLHDVGGFIATIPPLFQLLNANSDIPFQRIQLPRLESIRLRPPLEQLRLFVRAKSGSGSLDFFQRAHVVSIM